MSVFLIKDDLSLSELHAGKYHLSVNSDVKKGYYIAYNNNLSSTLRNFNKRRSADIISSLNNNIKIVADAANFNKLSLQSTQLLLIRTCTNI